MTKEEIAVQAFAGGFNCAQAVVSSFCEKYEMSKELALKISSGFGGGLRSGEVCGVITGAVMVIGLRYGQTEAGDTTTKRICYEKTEEFMKEFQYRYGAIRCLDILGYDVTLEEDREEIKKQDLFKVICEKQVVKAVNLLEELGY